MKQDWQEFIAERAQHLAFVHLTRRQDLVVKCMTRTYAGIDMLVTLLQHGLPTNRFFGVQAKAQDSDRVPSSSWTCDEIDRLRDVPFPLYLLLFVMDNDRGYYRLFNEPIVQHNLILILPQGRQLNGWHSLEKNSMNHIVNEVNDWYDTKHSSVA